MLRVASTTVLLLVSGCFDTRGSVNQIYQTRSFTHSAHDCEAVTATTTPYFEVRSIDVDLALPVLVTLACSDPATCGVDADPHILGEGFSGFLAGGGFGGDAPAAFERDGACIVEDLQTQMTKNINADYSVHIIKLRLEMVRTSTGPCVAPREEDLHPLDMQCVESMELFGDILED